MKSEDEFSVYYASDSQDLSKYASVLSVWLVYVCPYMHIYISPGPFLWTPYVNNALSDFLQTLHKMPFWLKGELIGFWGSM